MEKNGNVWKYLEKYRKAFILYDEGMQKQKQIGIQGLFVEFCLL